VRSVYNVHMTSLVTDGISFRSAWIAQLYKRSPKMIEMSTKDGYTYMVTAKTPAKIDEWLAADSKGKWFLANKDELVVDRIGF